MKEIASTVEVTTKTLDALASLQLFILFSVFQCKEYPLCGILRKRNGRRPNVSAGYVMW